MKYTDAMRANDYKVTFGSDTGRKVLTDILIKGNVYQPILTSDPIEAARQEGARHLALHIASFIKFDASKFIDTWSAPEEA